MAIKWSAKAVSDALDKVDHCLDQAQDPVDRAMLALREATKTPNIPRYMTWELELIGRQLSWFPSARNRIKATREHIPHAELQAERKQVDTGSQQSIM